MGTMRSLGRPLALLLLAAMPMSSAPADAASSDRSRDPCDVHATRPGNALPPWRARLDRGSAVHVARHMQRACRHLAGLIEAYRPKLEENDRAAKLASIIDRIRSNALAPIYHAHPDLRGRDLTGRKPRQDTRMTRATALRLRAVLKEMSTGTMQALGALDDLVPAQDVPALLDRFLDVTAEFTFATAPIYKRFPDIWNAEVKASARQVPPRTAESDDGFRKSAPPPGTVKLSERALSVVRKFLAAARKAGGADMVASIIWVHEKGSKGPDDARWRKSGPGLDLGAYSRREVPPDVIETIGGLPVILSAPDPSMLTGKTIDYQDGRFVIVADMRTRGVDEDLFPPDVPGNETPASEDSPAARACVAMVESWAARPGWTLGKRRVTQSDRWGVIVRVDFTIPGTEPTSRVNRAICWQQPDGKIGFLQSIGQDIPPL